MITTFKEFIEHIIVENLAQIKNLGVFEHPVTGEAHIVARDHGYGTDVMHAYSMARRINNQGYR